MDDQILQCKRKAGTDDVLVYVDDGVSGEYLDRPQLNKLLDDVENGLIDKVVCLSPDRLSRNSRKAEELLYRLSRRGVAVEFVNLNVDDSAAGQFSLGVMLQVAQYEKRLISERMSRGRRQKARQGKVVKNYNVYGYDYDKEKGQLVINEDEAAVVRLIFDLFTKPNDEVRGINGLAKKLTALGVPTKKHAKEWHRMVVRQIIENRAYVGEFYQNRWNTEGMLGNKFADTDEKITMTERPRDEWILVPCPSIIEKERFEYAQKLLEQSRRRWNGSERHEYLLSGLLRCADCGNTMTGRKAKNWGKDVYEYTDVKNVAGARHKGCGHKIKCSDLDDEIWNRILTWWQTPADEVAVALEDLSSVTYEQAELERIDREVEKAKNGQKKLFNLLIADDGLLEEDIRQQLSDLKSKELTLLERKAELEQALASYKQSEFSMKLLRESADEWFADKSPEDLTLSERKDFIRQVVREIHVSKDETIKILTF